MSAPLLQANKLAVSIAGKPVVHGLDLALQPGDCLAILGRNGAGKTTLLHTLAGLRAPDAGELRLNDAGYAEQGARSAAQARGLLLQHQGDAFPATVLETVLVGRHPHLSRFAWEGEGDSRIAREALSAVGLSELAQREVHTLSGGERQRVALATLLAQQPKLYLLDEPLAHLDLNHQLAMLDLFAHLAQDQEVGVAMVLHDPNLALRFCNRALLLHGDGTHDLGESDEQLDADRLTKLYGHPLRMLQDGARRWFIPE